jgi:conjugative transfer signal peptidase TraF
MKSVSQQFEAMSIFAKTFVNRTPRSLRASLTMLVTLAIVSACFANRQIVINTSPSVAPGLYVRWETEPAVSRLIDFHIPLSARQYVQDRTGKDATDWYILKPIVAGPGDKVDTTGSSLQINGRAIAPMPPELDSAGRPLPLWRQNRVLGTDEFFVFSARIPNSFDSRCYGPVTRRDIASVRRPLITW